MLPIHQATVETPPDITHSNIEEEDLDSNEEVLGPLLDKNGNRRQAAKQEHKDEDNRSNAFGAPITINKDRDISSNLGDSNNWILIIGESSVKED